MAYEGDGMRGDCPQCNGGLVWDKHVKNRVCRKCSDDRGTLIMWSAQYLDGYYDHDENVYKTKGSEND